MTVIEITPGGGWYTEILAPWLRDGGRYIGAIVDPAKASSENARDYYTKANQGLRDKLAAAPEQYAKAALVEFDLGAPMLGPSGSADAVLTFRNVHNWVNNGAAPLMFQAFHDVLKPGGVLGVVEHRANADVPAGDRSGYMSEAQVIALATNAGFVLEEKSEINANPKDTKDHPNGVWTLPPGNRHDAADAEKYQAIGESDRMTLRFRKP
jgi:predicted methyltransferase